MTKLYYWGKISVHSLQACNNLKKHDVGTLLKFSKYKNTTFYFT